MEVVYIMVFKLPYALSLGKFLNRHVRCPQLVSAGQRADHTPCPPLTVLERCWASRRTSATTSHASCCYQFLRNNKDIIIDFLEAKTLNNISKTTIAPKLKVAGMKGLWGTPGRGPQSLLNAAYILDFKSHKKVLSHLQQNSSEFAKREEAS